MTLANTQDLIRVLLPNYSAHNRQLTPEVVEGYWMPALSGHTMENIGPAVQLATARSRFLLTPGDLEPHLPDLLGHPQPEVAWSMYPRSESDSGWVTSEMMTAGRIVESLLAMGDMVAARKGFLESYAEQIRQARMANDKSNWIFSGERDSGYIEKTINAVNAGYITNQRGRKIIKTACITSGNDPAPLFDRLPDYHGEPIDCSLRLEDPNPVHTPPPLTEDGHKDAYLSREPHNAYDFALKMHENMDNDKIRHPIPSLNTWTDVINKMINVGGYELERLNRVWVWLCEQSKEVRKSIPNPFYFCKRFDDLAAAMDGG